MHRLKHPYAWVIALAFIFAMIVNSPAHSSSCIDVAPGTGRLTWVSGTIASVRVAVEASDGCVSWTYAPSVGFTIRPGKNDTRVMKFASAGDVMYAKWTITTQSPSNANETAQIVTYWKSGELTNATMPRYWNGKKWQLGKIIRVSTEFRSTIVEAYPGPNG